MQPGNKWLWWENFPFLLAQVAKKAPSFFPQNAKSLLFCLLTRKYEFWGCEAEAHGSSIESAFIVNFLNKLQEWKLALPHPPFSQRPLAAIQEFKDQRCCSKPWLPPCVSRVPSSPWREARCDARRTAASVGDFRWTRCDKVSGGKKDESTHFDQVSYELRDHFNN